MNHPDPIRRAALPEILFTEDVGMALDIPEHDALTLVRRGRVGPCFFVMGRPAVLREDFLEALTGISQSPMDDREVLP